MARLFLFIRSIVRLLSSDKLDPLGARTTSRNENSKPGPEVIKLFSCSTQLSITFFLLINVKMPTIVEQEK